MNGLDLQKKNMFLLILGLCLTLFATSCSDDDEPLADVPVTTLNMKDENNGETTLGETGVYINRAFNFRSSSWWIADLGASAPFPSYASSNLDNLSWEAAVQVNHRYGVYDPDYVRKFPSGKVAYEVGRTYYQYRVASLIEKDDKQIGATLEYAPLTSKELPESGTNIGSLYGNDAKGIDYPVPDAEEYMLSPRLEKEQDAVHISLSKGHLVITPTLIDYPTNQYEIYIRKGTTWTKLVFDKDSRY